MHCSDLVYAEYRAFIYVYISGDNAFYLHLRGVWSQAGRWGENM